MPDIVLTTLNARHCHTAFGLRCLQAALGPLQPRSVIEEFDLHVSPDAAAGRILTHAPRIIGVGVYIWNVEPAMRLVRCLKGRQPGIQVVLGGPEVSYDPAAHPATAAADWIICGEGETAFADLCHRLLAGERPPERIIQAAPPDLAALPAPYPLYTDYDLRARTIYVETARGCPFRCDYCLSAITGRVRYHPLARTLAEFERLLARGLRHFKFVDRTFNLDLERCLAILRFFRERHPSDLLLHFEMTPDRFPEELRALIQSFPARSLQFEIGIQTLNPAVAERINRRFDAAVTEANLRFLRERTGAYIHADLIAGLPGETPESFAAGFDRLLACRPHEIQVGILKRLRGAPIARHDREWDMIYNPEPPYDLRHNRLLSAEFMAEIRRFAQGWDRIANSGYFIRSAPLIWSGRPSAFTSFMEFTAWTRTQTGKDHGLALNEWARLLFDFLTRVRHHPPQPTAMEILRDYRQSGQRDTPEFLKPWIGGANIAPAAISPRPGLKRQMRHWAAGN